MGDTVVEARGVQRGYGRRAVLRGVDLSLRSGELVALLGPNGAGKTTLMKVLVGLLPASAGTLQAPSGRGVGWVPQGGAVYGRLSVRENLTLFARLLKLPGDARTTAEAAAHDAHLDPWLDSTANELSGGLRQRLNVAVGLLGDPGVLMLDEPTTGVDLEHRTALARVLRTRADAGAAVLHTTHAIEDAAMADRVVVLVGGRIAWDGDLDGIAGLAPEVELSPGLDGVDSPVERGLLRLWATGDEYATGPSGAKAAG